jgi:hypothetical protein
MKTTVVTHIYNEEYLLPFWIKHHQKYFDHGIILDYNSTDRSQEIAHELAPTWEFRKVDIPNFSAVALDDLVNNVEQEIEGTRIVLTITEFLLGNPRNADRQYFIPQVLLINMNDNFIFDENLPFHEQFKWGIGSDTDCIAPWWSRSLHQSPVNYGSDGSMTGRHYTKIDNGEFLIYRVSNCFVSLKMYRRRLQIQDRIPENEKANNMGVQHTNYNNGLQFEDLLILQNELRSQSRDLSELLKKYSM